MEKDAIERVTDNPNLCDSQAKAGQTENDFNMKVINTFIPMEHFGMETLATILPSLETSDLTVFAGFTQRVFRGPPIRLRPAPRVFTGVVTAVAAHLRTEAWGVFAYLDDWLLIAAEAKSIPSRLLQVTQELGFIVNWEKSELRHSHLSRRGNRHPEPARPSPDRVQSITPRPLSRGRSHVKARVWLQLLGHMASLDDVMQDCRLYMRLFQRHLLRHYRPGVDPLHLRIPLPLPIRRSLAVWTPLPSASVTTDASLSGWGRHCEGEMVSGVWTYPCVLPHINVLEI
nr:uncharacterized protein LOC129258617 [Lytechinus pictus]